MNSAEVIERMNKLIESDDYFSITYLVEELLEYAVEHDRDFERCEEYIVFMVGYEELAEWFHITLLTYYDLDAVISKNRLKVRYI